MTCLEPELISMMIVEVMQSSALKAGKPDQGDVLQIGACQAGVCPIDQAVDCSEVVLKLASFSSVKWTSKGRAEPQICGGDTRTGLCALPPRQPYDRQNRAGPLWVFASDRPAVDASPGDVPLRDFHVTAT